MVALLWELLQNPSLMCDVVGIIDDDPAKVGLVMESVPADELDDFVRDLAVRIAAVDSELLSAHKRIINLALEQMGAKTLQRISGETDARAHLSAGPRRSKFKADMASGDLKTALVNRDAPFGDGRITLRGRGS